jgi:hypothetical protein
MDKQTFYTELLDRLSALGVGDDFVKQQLIKFEKVFKNMSDDEVAAFIDRFDDLDLLAQGIQKAEQDARSASMADTDPAETHVADISQETAANDATTMESDDAPTVSDESSPVVTEVPTVDSDPELPAENTNDEKPGIDSVDISADSEKENDAESEIELDLDIDGADPFVGGDVISFTPVGREDVYGKDEPHFEDENDETPYMGRRRSKKKVEENDTPDVWEEGLRRDEDPEPLGPWMFWLYFLLSLPVALASMMATVAVFGALFFAIAVMIIGFVSGLVAITAVGTLVSVFGLIFGVAQLLSSAPIGIYECGLAIMFGAASMFVGILVYNVAVRLLPFLAKCLLRLFKFIFRQIRRFYVFLKRRCFGE